MTGGILTLNAGSSSLKFALFAAGEDRPMATGLADRIGPEGALKIKDGTGAPLPRSEGSLASHGAALHCVLDSLRAAFPGQEISAVGHRVVHGGIVHDKPVRLDAAVMAELERLAPFAPLHQPHNLAGIRAAVEAFPQAPQIACFDTAFHRSHPWVNDTFGLPRAYYDRGVRRYGFHGLSYDYIAGEIARTAPTLADGKVVVAHLGNGASLCGIRQGRSIASTMGFSALDGLPMGTRCGQLDPGVMLYLMDQEGMTPAQITDLLYTQSGLLGLSGISNDMRTLEMSEAPEAAEAIAYFTYRIQREIGAMAAAMGGIDAIVFTGGIGENSRLVRERVCATLGWMGVELEPGRNAAHARVISSDVARTTVMVIPTNEELVILRATRALLQGNERTAA
ncbi:acetate/propionate family kinase [Xinfangfangia pollutisoli]|uniref:acetate/propionate family kinase n=1 Tax=Xinfangfangia pollutisoli TaxID=2865960 RepID=UPI001CD81180|nr:acetate/propionate family kinase [Xinfangfangia pollutisoli]